MTVHPNSLYAYDGSILDLNQRELTIYQAVCRLGRATDRDIMKTLGFTDMNAVRPRVTSLVAPFDATDNPHGDWLVECDNEKDQVTGRTVRVLRALGADEREKRILERAQGQQELI